MADDVTVRARVLYIELDTNCVVEWSDPERCLKRIERALRAEYERGLEAAEKVCRTRANMRGWQANEERAPHSGFTDAQAAEAGMCADSIAALRQPPPTPDPSTDEGDFA